MKNYKLGTEKGIRPFSASAERQKKFLVKLFIKRLWVKRSEGKALGPGTPGTITLFDKVYCVILYMEDLPFYIPSWEVFTVVCCMCSGRLPYCIEVFNIRY